VPNFGLHAIPVAPQPPRRIRINAMAYEDPDRRARRAFDYTFESSFVLSINAKRFDVFEPRPRSRRYNPGMNYTRGVSFSYSCALAFLVYACSIYETWLKHILSTNTNIYAILRVS